MIERNNSANIVFLIDTSGSMYRNKMAAVNAALVECIDIIRNNLGTDKKHTIRVYYSTFDSFMSALCKINNIFEDDFPKFEVKAENGFFKLTRFQALYDGINRLLKGKEFYNCKLGLVLISDGKAVDSKLYMDELEKVKNNDIFRNAVRLVATVEKDTYTADEDLLEFVGYKADRIFDLNQLANEINNLCRIVLGTGFAQNNRNELYDSIFG